METRQPKRKQCGPVPGKFRTFFDIILALTYIQEAGTLALVFSPP